MNSLENLFPTLPLGSEARDGPHLDFHASMELFAPHVPHPVAGCGHRAVLQRQCRVDLLGLVVTQTHTHYVDTQTVIGSDDEGSRLSGVTDPT